MDLKSTVDGINIGRSLCNADYPCMEISSAGEILSREILRASNSDPGLEKQEYQPNGDTT